MVDSSSRETPWPTFPPSLPPSLTLEIVYARLVVVVAKSIKSASDRCAGRRFGVGQLSGSERDRDIELLKITVDFVSRKIFRGKQTTYRNENRFLRSRFCRINCSWFGGYDNSKFSWFLMRRFKVNFSRVLFRIWIFWVILILVKIFFSF